MKYFVDLLDLGFIATTWETVSQKNYRIEVVSKCKDVK